MIKKDELTPIGKIQKTHGIGGEMNISLSAELNENVKFLIFEIDNIFVPFFIESLQTNSANGYVKLESIDTEAEAKMLMGKDIFVQKTFAKESDEIFDYKFFIGFEIFDQNRRSLGKISEVNDETDNVLIYIEENDLVIPFQADFIRNINRKKRTIEMELPEGLLEL